ncbi:hypothetical protein BDQ12DRAFT_730740 [Crucibulum laeve]|uniref:HECT-type E3 ubiquitin transferase n=1 Tax=Crucibulum laeve TaxID=68775 RepID=A0A5C3MH42_9AGAR|nr:hypothetical protein BDQ12DRAFT_730740 [Crucibulum laeve]
MKILHKSKKVVAPPPQVADLITTLVNTSNDDLSRILTGIDSWKWPRSDLNAWIKVLNKFDAILEEVIREYDVDKLQLNPFTPATKKIVSEILRFERLLLENSTNRKTFSSYDRLNSLLSTSDLDILILTLNLLLRPSQQYSAQPQVSHSFGISSPRLLSLAKRWPQLREYGIGVVDLASAKGNSELESLPAEAREVNFNFYRTDSGPSSEPETKADADVPDVSQCSPRKPQTSTPGAITIHIDEATLTSKPLMNVLADIVDEYSVPEEEKFELLCRMRAATALTKGQGVTREKLVNSRLLAIAIYGHTHSETQATSSLFLYEPDLIVHIAELLQVDQGIPIPVQTAALAALDSLARYRNKIQEVLTAVNAGVNHGILMALFRKTVADVANPESKIPHAFVEALLSFVTFIASHASGGNMVVGAGLIPLLIQLIDNKSPSRLPVVSKTMQLVDNVLYSFTNAFNLFCTARGVDMLVERIEHEIDFDIKEHGESTQSYDAFAPSNLPVTRVAVLKHTLRSMHRMMQSSGTAEGLRGLIDMSLLKSVKKIIEHRGLFGQSIFPIAINIMATFVHNEPTSLAIIQEAGLPETLFNAIETGIEPAIEVIQAIPNAIGALCLNEAGQAQLARRPSIIPSLFSIFTSERHLKVLIDKENAVLVGTAIDELIRHHPSLKTSIYEALKSTMSMIEDLGMNHTVADDLKQWYQLLPVPRSAAFTPFGEDVTIQDVEMTDVVGSGVLSSSTEHVNAPNTISADDEDAATKPHDNIVVSFIDVLGRFLEGLFQHTPHCKDFISGTDGLTRLGRLTGLPCLPYDFANSVASDSMVQVMRTLIEVATSETLLHLAGLVKESLDDTRQFWESVDEQSKLLGFVDLSGEDELYEANQRFRCLVTLHIRITLLSDVFATAGYAHGRSAIGLLQTLMSNTSAQVVTDLGALHRASTWENIALNVGLTSKGIDVQATPSSSPLESSPSSPHTNLPDVDGSLATNGPIGAANGVQNVPASNAAGNKKLPKAEGPRDYNAAALKHLTHGLPNALAPFFQAMVKMFHARRNPEPAQKKQISESSAIVAGIMLQHLNLETFGDISSVYTYYSVIFGLFTLLLVDERTSTNTLHTVQLSAFYRAGGLDAIFRVCQQFISTIETVVQIPEEDRSDVQHKQLLHAYGGIKVALHLLHPIISSKALFESGQTLLIMTRDKKDTDPDYFEPHNFLVKLRLATLPLVQSLWQAPWLIQAPLGVSRSVVRTVLELVSGENEESKGDAHIDISPASVAPPRPTGPDETRVQVLVDMGFPRSAAERALVRTHNNVNAATELLLAHPFPLPPDPEPDQAAPVSTATLLEETSAAEASVSVTSAPEGEQTPADAPVPELAVAAVVGKNVEEWRKELDEAREPLRRSISRQSLRLIDEHLPLLFDLQIAFTKPGSHQHKAIQDIVDDIKAFTTNIKEHEQALANRCRLLALVLCETPAALDQELKTTLLDHLVALLSPSIVPEHPPKWLAAALLIIEALFTLADEPRVISHPKENEPIVQEPISVGPDCREARATVFSFCLRLLAFEDLLSDELLSVLRLFVLFTRDREMVAEFVQRDGPTFLFNRIRSSPVTGASSYIATILRHIIEDAAIIQRVMHLAIKRYFAQPRTQIVDMGTYVRNCSSMALRDSNIFIETTKSLCQLGQPFSTAPHISLKPHVTSSSEQASQTDNADQSDMQVDLPPNPATNNDAMKSADSIVHLLINELMTTMKVINDFSSPVSHSKGDIQPALPVSEPEEASRSDAMPEDEDNNSNSRGTNVYDKYQYLCFLMQCLTELLFSYDTCKVAFLSYSPKKRLQTPAKEPQSKYRLATLQFLLSDLITFGTLDPQPNARIRNRHTLCNWAMSVIVALCVDTSSTQEAKEVSSELVSVRKFVLESVSRAIRDLPSTENVDAKYGRLLALVDLCHRLLTVRFNSSRKHQDEVPTHIAKIMLEKNFVATLTTALSDVDLNYPNARTLVASILRPLEYLTKVAIKMSRTSHKGKESFGGTKSESESSLESDEEESMDDSGREETPDLYRNSALGMYGGEMDDGHFDDDDDDDMDDDDEEDDEDVEMDFGEETGSEDTSNTEDEHEEDDMDEAARVSGGGWDDADEEDRDGLIEHNEEEEDDDDEQDEDDGDDGDEDEMDEEMLWEDIHGEGDPLGLGGDDLDGDDEQGVPIQVIHDEEDEPDMASDEEEYAMGDGMFNAQDVFNFGGVDTGNARDGAGLFVPRRHRGAADDSVQVFGRARNPPAAPLETTTHPLLLDASASSNRGQSNQNRGLRQTQRLVATGPTDLFQTIDEMIGGGSVQLFQQIMSRGRGGGGPETFRLDVPAGTLVNLERGYLQHRRGPPGGIFSAAIRVERASRPQSQKQGREFDPLLTLQRWGEEVKVLNGDFVGERAGNLVNHIIVALLPAAIEAAKEAKLREEEAVRRREAKADEEAAAEAKKNTDDSNPELKDGTYTPHPTTPLDASRPPVLMESEPQQQDQVMEDIFPDTGEMDAVMADSSSVDTPPTEVPPEGESIVEDASESVNAPAEVAAEPSSSQLPIAERVTVMIHGSAVDITDTGIDPTFLEALPDDMREEVLNQHVRDQRAARVERPPDSQISSEFLDALPPEIRAEIIQQETMERSRLRADDTTPSAPVGEPAEIDPASFIASLDPSLRQAVLMDQDDGFIQSLPSHMIAEAGAYRESQPIRHFATRHTVRSVPASTSARKFAPQHDAIQLLDKTGVAVLVRLLFFPQVLKKTLLFRVLVNLCENAKTRTELFNLLLSILQDGTGDLAAVDKSFSQMSFRNSKPQTPKSTGKQKAGSEYLSALALPASQIEAVPDLIAQRCLEALTYIVSSNELASLFFLTEHELPIGLRKAASKKGKGKEKQLPQIHYPIVLLLGLLDRQSLLRTPAIMESVVGLLATVTRPLTSLKDKKTIEQESSKLVPTEGAQSQGMPVSGSTEQIAPGSAPPAPATENTTPILATSLPATSAPVTSALPSAPTNDRNLSIEAVEEKILLANPPQVPHAVLRLIVNILTVGECSGRSFQQSLALIQHLSYIPDARDVIANELKSKAQEFGQALYDDLDELATALQESRNEVVVSSVAAKFSPASSTQAKLLRVLKTIDYMYTPKAQAILQGNSEEDVEKVQAIYESFRFTPLWRRLGDCLSVIEEKPDTEHIATVLLPLIEALMVVCKYVGSEARSTASTRALRASASPRSPTTPRESMEDLFVTFTDAHRKVLNLMVRNNPSLMSGSFSLLVNNPRVLDFDNKRNYFNQQLHRRPHIREHHGTLQLNVRRARVFEDSFQHLQRKTGDQIKHGKLSVRFYDEEGVDAGGVTREWFQILARQMFDPNNALFQPCAADKLTYQPNKNSWVNPEHLSFFKFVGRVIGKAIYDGRLLDAYFARSLYRQLLGKPVDYKDVEWVDPEYYNSLCWILENDPTLLELTFSVEADEFGVNRIVPLKEGGESIPVTQENKREFVQLSAQYRLYSSIEKQIENFSNGFYEIIPKDLITIFNEQELELLISGTPDIDVDEWRAATDYNGYTSSDPNIVWWWRALKSFNRDERAKVLSFATGTSRVPLSGFVDLQGVQGVQRFSIHRAYGEPDRLPQAHTCFNQIDLPQYTSYDMLRQQLLMAINEGGEGFAFS